MSASRRVGPLLPLLAGLLLVVGCALACTAAPDRAAAGDTAPGGPATSATTSPRPSESPDQAGEPFPAFSATVVRVGPRLRERMAFSYHAGCPVRLRALRYLRVSYVDFRGSARTGEMVVHATQARAVVRVFRRLYDERWPIRRMRLVDDYRGDDDLSMAANNTSAFNCRLVASGARWSEHSYGRAVDVNPVQNPYVVGSSVAPEEGREYAAVDRSADAAPVRGVIRSDDVVVAAFAGIGWEWGGDWVNSKDYQHFSASGR